MLNKYGGISVCLDNTLQITMLAVKGNDKTFGIRDESLITFKNGTEEVSYTTEELKALIFKPSKKKK